MPPGSILGNVVVRKEDPRLLRGSGTFTANLDLDGALCAVLSRSVVAHAGAIGVDYDPLPVVVDPEAAIAADAPQIFPGVAGNIALAVTGPADDDLFADSAVVVRGRFVNQRMAAMPMEPNAFAAEPD